jgi:2-polyprenyl-3-methyl-5-hydroxy-6-metoxy-1,4-benzoquinol methylase
MIEMSGLSTKAARPIADSSQKVFATRQRLDLICDDSTPLQQRLNDLYAYGTDLPGKIYHRWRFATFQTIMDDLIRKGAIRNFGRALDIGCNAGFYSKMISDYSFAEVLGIDIIGAYVAKANQAFRSEETGKRLSFEVADATALADRKPYDFILCSEVIEHTSHPEVVVDSIMSLLVPGGVGVISLPNGVSLGYLTRCLGSVLKGRGINQDLREHMRYPCYKGPKMFRRRGAQILSSSGVNCLFNDPLLRALQRMPGFVALNKLNFWLSRNWPLKALAQFYFFVIRKPVS